MVHLSGPNVAESPLLLGDACDKGAREVMGSGGKRGRDSLSSFLLPITPLHSFVKRAESVLTCDQAEFWHPSYLLLRRFRRNGFTKRNENRA